MKYYVIKKKTDKIRADIIDGVMKMDKDAEFVDTLEDCDIAVLQQGWTKSKTAVEEKERAYFKLKKQCKEGYVYTDRYTAHLN